MNRNHKQLTCLGIFSLSFLIIITQTSPAYSMHIMEGFLPWGWSVFWWGLTLPFLLLGMRHLTRLTKKNPELKLLLALSGAFSFVLSALKLPSVTGSSSHPTGTGLGAILFTPSIMTVLGTLVLLFQAILLAHGGLTTLGANAFSMAIIGPWVAYLTYRFFSQRGRLKIGVFAASALGNIVTYLITSLQLALAFPSDHGGVIASFGKFAAIFAITQVPLAITEGLLTVLVWNWLETYASTELEILKTVHS